MTTEIEPTTHTPPRTGPATASRALLAGIGRTPLVELSDVAHERGARNDVRVFAKLEAVNPGGSVKDRPVARMLTRALGRGDLEGRRVLDSSSGNAGIAYAWIGAALGVPVTLVVPGNASRERLDRIRAHGAELITTDPMEGYDEALREAMRLAEAHPDRYWYANQYANADNWTAHELGTGQEILSQLRAEGLVPDVFVAGIGTGGTITGVGRRLRGELGGHVRLVGVSPEPFPGIEGLKPLGDPDDIVPDLLDLELLDDRRTVSIDDAVAVTHRLAADGLAVGPSSGANLHVALEAACAATSRATIVTILCDTGERYVSTGLWGS